MEEQTNGVEANEEGRGWGWAAFWERLAEQPMLETKRSKLPSTGSRNSNGSALFFDPDARTYTSNLPLLVTYGPITNDLGRCWL